MINESFESARPINGGPIGRTLPHSIEAEEFLLACCFLDGADVLSRCIEARIQPESFYDGKHGIIFDTLLALYNRQSPIDISIVAEELKTTRQLDAIGGYAFLTQVSSRIPTTAQAGYFIAKVRELALLREIIRSATGAVEDCYNFSGGIGEFVDGIERKLFLVTQQRLTDRTNDTAKLTRHAMDTLTGMLMHKGQLTGLRTGFKDLDNLTWGFQPTDMIILAARPSMGKTSLALNIAEAAALPRQGEPATVLLFSLEQGADQVMQRLIVSRARVNMKLLRDGLLSKNGDEQMRLIVAADELSKAPVIIDDTSSASVLYIRAKARRIHQRTPLGLIIVDYLQLMAPSSPKIPREQQVAEMSRGLKALAKDLNLPVLVLSQLNRRADEGSPKLSDLRESGAIEQDADVVLFLARPKDADEKYQVAADTAELIVAKQRNGPVGELRLTFLRDIVRFENFHQ